MHHLARWELHKVLFWTNPWSSNLQNKNVTAIYLQTIQKGEQEMLVWFGLVWFYGISIIVGYLMPNPFYTYK